MPRRNHRPQHTSRKAIAKAETERQQRREAIQEAGGWYLYTRQQRLLREQAQNGQTTKEDDNIERVFLDPK